MLLEGAAPVVKIIVGKSQTLYSSVSKRGKDKNNGLLSIGAVNIDIPQHPVALHGVMTRSSKQLSTTLQASDFDFGIDLDDFSIIIRKYSNLYRNCV